MSYTEALTRISQIQQQIQQLRTGQVPSSSPSSTTGGAATTGSTGATTFNNALMQASAAPGTGAVAAVGDTTGAAAGTLGTSGLATALGTGATGGVALPVAASSMLTSDQQAFASQLAAQTGLNPGVISAWLLAEESGGAAQSRQAAGNNDWLNIGYTDSGTYGSGDSVWSDPVTAANATAGWLKGQNTIPGYGTASAGIQGILSTVGQSPAAQIAALQGSGWASSGYPDLPGLYGQVSA